MLGHNILSRSLNYISNRLLINKNTQFSQFYALKSTSSADKLKELKLPEKPKKPLSAYFRFVQEQRPVLLKHNPQLKSTELIKKCAEGWRNLSDNDKHKYEEQYKVEMEGFAQKYLQYTSTLTPSQKQLLQEVKSEKDKAKEHRKLKKLYRETNKPKRPLGAYTFFITEQAKKSNQKYNELLTNMKGKWSSLSATEKAVYVEKATKDKERYEKEMKIWEDKMIKEGRQEIIRTGSLSVRGPSKAKLVKKSE